MEVTIMNPALKQANFQIPEDLLNELRKTVGKGELRDLEKNNLPQYWINNDIPFSQ